MNTLYDLFQRFSISSLFEHTNIDIEMPDCNVGISNADSDSNAGNGNAGSDSNAGNGDSDTRIPSWNAWKILSAFLTIVSIILIILGSLYFFDNSNSPDKNVNPTDLELARENYYEWFMCKKTCTSEYNKNGNLTGVSVDYFNNLVGNVTIRNPIYQYGGQTYYGSNTEVVFYIPKQVRNEYEEVSMTFYTDFGSSNLKPEEFAKQVVMTALWMKYFDIGENDQSKVMAMYYYKFDPLLNKYTKIRVIDANQPINSSGGIKTIKLNELSININGIIFTYPRKPRNIRRRI
jgi:hypothetical protein